MDAVHSTRPLPACNPVLPVRPFAALPHDVAATPGVKPVDVAVMFALLFWARDKDHCWPSDWSIGRRVDRSVSTVQRSLKRLESLGLVVRVETDANRTGRIVRLLWRAPDDRPPRSPVTDPPRARMTDEGKRSVKRDSLNPETRAKTVQRQRPRTPEPTPAAPVPVPDVAPAPADSAPTATASTSAPEETPRPAPQASPRPLPAPWTAPPAPRTSAPPPAPEKKTGRFLPPSFACSPLSAPSPAPVRTAPAPAEPPARRRPTFAERAAATRELTRTWATGDDPILRREAERRLAPRPAPPPEPETMPELLARIRESPVYPSRATEALVQAFNDRKSWRGFHALMQKAWEGDAEPAALVKAWERATDGKARNPGAVFMAVAMREGKGS